MGSQGIMKQIKTVVADIYDEKEGFLKNPRTRLTRKELPDEVIQFIYRFVDLLLNTAMLSRETRAYITDEYITYNGVCTKLKEETGKEFNHHTVQTKIWYDKRKIVTFFGENVLTNLIDLEDTSELTRYNKAIDDAYKEYGQSKLWNNLTIKIPETTEYEENVEVSEEDLVEFLATIGPYNKKHVRFIESSLDKDVVGYCKRLLKTNNLSETEQKHKEMLVQLLSD